MTNQTPAGWYPAEEGKVRWWDGTAWTDHYLDEGAATAPSAPSQAPADDPASGVATPPQPAGTGAATGPATGTPVPPSSGAPSAQVPPAATPPAGTSPGVASGATPASPPPTTPPPAAAPPAQAPATPPTGGPPTTSMPPAAAPPTTPTTPYGAPMQQQVPPQTAGVPPVPTPGAAPGYAAATAAPPKKRSLAWLWILLGALALLLIVGLIVLFAVVLPGINNSSPDPTPTPAPTVTVTAEPTPEPTPTEDDTGNWTAAEQELIDEVQDRMSDWQLEDGEIITIGQAACVAAEDQPAIDLSLVQSFGEGVAETYLGDRYFDAPANEQEGLAFEGAVIGEVGTFYLCNEYYQPWWDAVEEWVNL